MSLLLKTISIIAPAKCLLCAREGQDLCASCAQNVVSPLPERCWRCQTLTLSSKTCSTCYRYSSLKYVWAVGEYEDALKRAIQAYKFERLRGLALPLAGLLYERLPMIEAQPIIVNVPTATTRRRVRGYDHAELLARNLSNLLGNKHIPLLRRQTQSRQVGAKRQTRLEQLKNAFRVIRSEYVGGKDVLLVDDVITTGATLTTCAKMLRIAGAKSVSAVVLAQKS